MKFRFLLIALTVVMMPSCAGNYKWVSKNNISNEKVNLDYKTCKKQADKIASQSISYNNYEQDQIDKLDMIEAQDIFLKYLNNCMKSKGYEKIKLSEGGK